MIFVFFCFRNHYRELLSSWFFRPKPRATQRNVAATNLDLDLVLVDLFGRHGSQELAGDPGRHAWCNAARCGWRPKRRLARFGCGKRGAKQAETPRNLSLKHLKHLETSRNWILTIIKCM